MSVIARDELLHRCHLCHQWLDPVTAHDLHDEDCTRSTGMCRCGLLVCAACCPECASTHQEAG